jgi:beta-glucanase (GH16 family)
MKKYYPCLVLLILFGKFGYSQMLPIDFSGPQDNFVAFSGSNFSIVTDPENTSNPVGEFFNNGANEWQGFFIDLEANIALSENQVVTLSFYQFDSNSHTIIVKLENGSDGDVEVTRVTNNQGWSTDLSFDFANATYTGTSTPVNAQGAYSRLTIFVDGGAAAAGTYLIDDINGSASTTDPNELDVIYTDLVWADEFDVDGPIDSNKWFHQTQLPTGVSWYNGEEQHYTNRIENSFVENGVLNIVARKEVFTDQGETKEYTSARLNSKFAFTYGRVDVRAKLPLDTGTWPAIWMLGKNIDEPGGYWQTQGFGTINWPDCGEIDIMEHGLHSTNEVSCAIHTPSSFGATINTQTQFLNDVANEFHVYSMNWSPNQITFLIDDVGYYTYNPPVKNPSTWPFDDDQYLLLNIAMGGFAIPDIDPNFIEDSMVIDYVRVYQNNGLGVDDMVQSDIHIFPNPASDRVFIQTQNSIDRIELYNVMGQLIISRENNVDEINMGPLDSGIYNLKVYASGRVMTKKVIRS